MDIDEELNYMEDNIIQEPIENNFTMIPNAVNDDGLSVWAARLYWALMAHANYDRDKGYIAFPSYATLSKICGMSEDKVADAINELVDAGWIRDIKKCRKAKSGGTFRRFNVNEYHLNVKKKVNQNLINKRLENKKKYRFRTLKANAIKASKVKEYIELVTRSERVTDTQTEVTLPQPITPTAGNGYNKINRTKLIISPDSLEPGKKFYDYPGTLWLLNIIWDEKLLRAKPPLSKENLKLYKRWQGQLKQLISLGSKDELTQALREGLFYNGFQVDEPSQMHRKLESKVRAIREDKRKGEEYLRGFLPKPLPDVKEDYAPMPEDIGNKKVIEQNNNLDKTTPKESLSDVGILNELGQKWFDTCAQYVSKEKELDGQSQRFYKDDWINQGSIMYGLKDKCESIESELRNQNRDELSDEGIKILEKLLIEIDEEKKRLRKVAI